MAKVGYIFRAEGYESAEADSQWMADYGCVRVVDDCAADGRLRPNWQRLLQQLDRGDELVVGKLSNAVRNTQELARLVELCRVQVVRLISINDRIDTADSLFPDTRPSDVLTMVGSLPAEVAAQRNTAARFKAMKVRKAATARGQRGASADKASREKMIATMYRAGKSIDDIWQVSGFRSRSSVFRILNKCGVALDRGKFSGPLGPRRPKTDETQTEQP